MMQVTTLDERWYGKTNKKGDLIDWKPSLTWIGSTFPKGKGYEMWLGKNGYDEAQELKNEAGARGSRVHHCIDILAQGFMKNENISIKMGELFTDMDGEAKALQPDEWYAVMTFVDWFKEKPTQILSSEKSFLADKFGCTIDLRIMRDDIPQLVDLKTSQDIYPNSEIQLTGQRIACEQSKIEIQKTSILQVGYRRNRRGWKETEYEYQPEFLDAAYIFWKKQYGNVKPLQRDYPLELSLK